MQRPRLMHGPPSSDAELFWTAGNTDKLAVALNRFIIVTIADNPDGGR